MLKLDARDIDILRVLSRDGRLAKADLARRVNLSPAACWQRLKRLEDAGVISGYRADISLKHIAASVTVFVVVELENHRAEAFQTFERVVRAREEVIACWALGGGFDYLMQVVARDIEAYQDLIDGLLDQRVGLARYYSYIVTKPVKSGGAPPLDVLLSGPAEKQ